MNMDDGWTIFDVDHRHGARCKSVTTCWMRVDIMTELQNALKSTKQKPSELMDGRWQMMKCLDMQPLKCHITAYCLGETMMDDSHSTVSLDFIISSLPT